jgi:hypothetical protein
MAAVRVVESSGSIGVLQSSNLYGGFEPTNLLFNTASSGIEGSVLLGADTALLISGTKDSIGTSNKGVTVFSGDVVISGTLACFDNGLSGSLTRLPDGTSYLAAGDNITITSASNGQVVIAGSSTVNSTIGDAEDGDYTDGLFTDFTTNTAVGTAVDRINEVLKALAPSPAPSLDDINSSNTGTQVRLSFGSSNDQSSATPAYANVAASAGVASAVDVNGLYTVTTSSNNIRLAVFDGDTHVSGVLNADIESNSQGNSVENYPAFSFGDGDTGVLRLDINGTVIKEIDLTVVYVGSGSSGLGTGSHLDANGSGFNFFSTATTGTFSNGNSFNSFKHRTGQFVITSGSQRIGWNYARVSHVKTGSTVNTNYIEWVNDDNPDALGTAGSSMEFEGSGSIHLSGIEYFLSGTSTYKTRVTNAYKYVYDTNAITFNTTSGSLSTSTDVLFTIPDQSKPTIGGSETHAKVLHLTGSGVVSGSYFLSGALTGSVDVTHPLKANLSAGGQAVVGEIMMYSSSNTSTNQAETFQREDYRIVSGAYDTQASLVNTANIWTGSVHMSSSNGGHSDGLQFFATQLVSPLNTIHAGNFSGITNAPDDNPDYSALSGQRTFYRWFKNETGATKYDLTIAINGSGTIVNAATSLNASRVRAFLKFPSNGTRSTGWLDLATEFVLDSYADNDGAHTANGSLSFDSSLNATNYVTLGTVGIGNNEYIGLRFEASADWTGYLSDITVTFGAGTGTLTAIPDLDDIDCNDDGDDCNLSFGSSKAVSGYTNVGTAAGFAATDVNGLYQTAADSNNLRRSVFALDTVIEGDLNEDVTANTPDYIANSFSDANSGSLKIEVNGSVVHSVEITGSYNLVGSGNPGSGTAIATGSNGSGFFDLSVWAPAEYDNEVPHYLEIYRTGKWRVGTSDQRNGWNYARVIHSVGGSDRATNYVEWVNDNNSNALSAAGVAMQPFADDNLFHLSGVKYFIQPSASIETRISNLYKNVYSDSSSAVSFTNLTNATGVKIIQSGSGLSSTKSTSSSTDSLQTLSTITNSQNQDAHITGSIQFSQSKSLSGSFTTAYSASGSLVFVHPLKANLTTTQMTSSILQVYSASDNSNANTIEYFNGEVFRIQSGSYESQSEITISTKNWASTGSLNDNGNFPNYYNGLMLYDGYLISPLNGGNYGDFRRWSEGGVLDSPPNNVNYSSLGVATREYYRGFLNNTSDDRPSVTITIKGDAEIVGITGANQATLGTNKNIFVEVNIPGKTAFLDLGKPSAGAGNISAGDGCLSGDLDTDVDGGGAANVCTFNGVTADGTTSGAEYITVKISAHKHWTGYVSEVSVAWSA